MFKVINRNLSLFYKLTTGDSIGNSGLNVNYVSNAWCKIYTYTSYSWCAISAWLLVFISIERCVSVVVKTGLPSFFSNGTFEIIIVFAVIAYNCLLYTPFLIFVDLTITTTQTGNGYIFSRSQVLNFVRFYKDLKRSYKSTLIKK